MSDLITQLREYGTQLDSKAAPLRELTPGTPFRNRVKVGWRGPLLAFGTAAAIVVVAFATAFLLRVPEGADPATPAVQPTVTTTVLEATEPEAAFSWYRDDLSEWVTEGEMTDLLTGLMGREGQDALEGEVLLDHSEGDTDWTWTFRTAGDAGTWRIIAHNGYHLPEGGRVEPTETDPRLPIGVTYEQQSGFAHGFYGLSGPNSNQTICMTVFPPGAGFGYPDRLEVEAHEDRVFAIASMMLREMGWTDLTE